MPPVASIYDTRADPDLQPSRGGFGFLNDALDKFECLPAAQAVLHEIETSRQRCRPGYCPTSMFRAFWAKFMLGERFVVQFIERLRASPELRKICGFDDAVPSASTFSRFFARLAEHRDFMESIVPEIVERHREHLPDLGESVAIDGSDIPAWADPSREDPCDVDARWGYRTPRSKSSQAKENSIYEYFFGRKIHMVCDAKYGIPLAYELRSANEHDSPLLPDVVGKALRLYPWLKPRYLLGDRGYDAASNHEFLLKRGIVPIILMRKPPKGTLHDDLYDEKGRPACLDGETPMEFVRTDPKTDKHLFRCPPEGCVLKERSTGAMRYCDTRELHAVDWRDSPRAVGVVARSSPEWQQLYSQRQTVERLFHSLKHSRLLDRSLYVESRKIELHVLMSVASYLITTLQRIEVGDMRKLRHMRIGVDSLVS